MGRGFFSSKQPSHDFEKTSCFGLVGFESDNGPVRIAGPIG